MNSLTWLYICLCTYMLLVAIYVYVHIFCRWWYMFMCIYGGDICLCAYMLLVVIYVMCIYVVGDYICCMHICCWWISLTCYWWWIVVVSMYWNMLVWTCGICMKYVLLWSSPSSHTIVVGFHLQLLLLNTYVFIMRVVMVCLYASGATSSEMKELVPHILELV